MNILFLSQNQFKSIFNVDKGVDNSTTIVISIVTADSDCYAISTSFLDSIQLVFEDNEQSFTPSLANSIIDFINKHKNSQCSQIIVHCLMGISRSAAVALFLEEYINSAVIDDIQRSPYRNYNRFVYSTLINTLGFIPNEKSSS